MKCHAIIAYFVAFSSNIITSIHKLAANYLREKRYCLDNFLSTTDSEFSSTAGKVPESVMPSVFIGQSARLVEQGDMIEVLP